MYDRPLDLRATREYLADPRNVFLVAYDGRRAVGFLRGTALRPVHSRHPQLFLYELGVARSHRRRGIATALVHRLLRHCRRRGFEEVFVLTSPAHRAAVRLYRSTGAVTETRSDRLYVYRLRPTVR